VVYIRIDSIIMDCSKLVWWRAKLWKILLVSVW